MRFERLERLEGNALFWDKLESRLALDFVRAAEEEESVAEMATASWYACSICLLTSSFTAVRASCGVISGTKYINLSINVTYRCILATLSVSASSTFSNAPVASLPNFSRSRKSNPAFLSSRSGPKRCK